MNTNRQFPLKRKRNKHKTESDLTKSEHSNRLEMRGLDERPRIMVAVRFCFEFS
jgi:hypothetical protein